MANLMEYLDFISNKGLDEEPFNEVDNLVFSLFAYINLQGIKNIEHEFLSIRDVRDAFFNLHSTKEIKQMNTYTSPAPLLLDPLAVSKRYQDLKIGYYCDLLDADDVVQFCAMTFLWNNLVYIAFRGTDHSLVGWKEDFHMSFKSGVPSQVKAVEYVNSLPLDLSKAIHLGGHSKGGNLAIFASAFCNTKIRENITAVWANDSPGFLDDVVQEKSFKDILDKVNLIVPESSVIGMLMDNVVKPKVVKSSALFFLQHDAFSWVVEGTKFVESEKISDFANFINLAIKNFIVKLKPEAREEVVRLLFYCLESAEIETLMDFRKDRIRAIKKIKATAEALPDEQRSVIQGFFAGLAQSAGNLFMENLRGRKSGTNEV